MLVLQPQQKTTNTSDEIKPSGTGLESSFNRQNFKLTTNRALVPNQSC
jgi:hypothetical protein